MSLWGFDGEDNTLTSWSSLNQFDDMVWSDFGQTNGDHVVPDPNNSTESSWLSNGDVRKRLPRGTSLSASTLRSSSTSTGVADSLSEIISGTEHISDEEDGSKEGLLLQNPLPSTLVGNGWTDFGNVKVNFPLEPEPFRSDPAPVPHRTDARAGDERMECHHNSMRMMREDAGLYICEEDASMVTDPFAISDVRSQERGLAMFENENAERKAETLLELGWENIGNLDDMDKLFRNNDASFEPVMVNGTDGLEWPSSSPPPVSVLDSGIQFEKFSAVSERAMVKVEVDAVVDKTDSVFGDNLAGLTMGAFDDVVADSGSPRPVNLPASAPFQQHLARPTDKRDGARDAKSSDAVLHGKERAKEETGQSGGSLPETENANLAQACRARRHAANRKRSEERFRRTTAYRKLSPGPPYNVAHADVRQRQTLPLRLPTQLPQRMQSTPAHPLQFFPPTMTPGSISASHQLQMPQNIPYIQVGYPLGHAPAISSCPSAPMMHMQHPQPMFVDIQQPGNQVQKQPLLPPQPNPLASKGPQQQHQVRQSFDSSGRPPISSPSMTPQEKLEKLRWRQQMQARMAVEQQQQLLASQSGRIETPMYHSQQQAICQSLLSNQQGKPFSPPASLKSPMSLTLETSQRLVVTDGDAPSTNDREDDDDDDSSLEGSVLCQLKTTVAALDVGTRLCIRDALYRLARSAMKRRAAGGDSLNASQGSEDHDSDGNAVESSTASGPPSRHSRATSMSMVETETNPIDRSIAKLLFSKPPVPIFGRTFVYMPENSPPPVKPELPMGPFTAIAPSSH